MTELTIREFRRRDARPLLAMATEAFATERAAFGTDPRREARELRALSLIYPLQRRLPNPLGIALVGVVEGKPVGVVIAEPRKESWYVNTVMVGAEHRRRGYGRALVAAVCTRAAAAGANRVLLHLREDNLAAYGLYSSLGFKTFEQAHRMTLDPERPVEPPSLPEGYALVPCRRYDRRALAVRDACREPGARELYGPSRTPGLLERALGALFRPADAERLAIVSDRQWVGIYQYVQNSPNDSVSLAIDVLPAHRGVGLERALLARAVNRAVAHGAPRLGVWVDDSDAPLREACAELGFVTQFVMVGMVRALAREATARRS